MFIEDASMIKNVEYVSNEVANYLIENKLPLLTIKDGKFGFRKTLKYKYIVKKMPKELKAKMGGG